MASPKGYYQPGPAHPNWKGGPKHDGCVDCGVKMAGHQSTRCRPCESKNRTGKGKGLTLPDCLDCGIKLKDTRSKRCRKCAHSGPLARHWKGGVTPAHKLVRRSVEFRQWREAVFQRDDYTCQFCGKRGGKIHPDHIKPFALFPELWFEISNGRTLCVKCHEKTDTYGAKMLNKTRKDFLD